MGAAYIRFTKLPRPWEIVTGIDYHGLGSPYYDFFPSLNLIVGFEFLCNIVSCGMKKATSSHKEYYAVVTGRVEEATIFSSWYYTL